MDKEIKRFEAQSLRSEKRDLAVTMKYNSQVYETFKKNMKNKDLSPALVINQFMKLTNDLLSSRGSGEVCFIFEKEEVGKK